MIAYLVPVRTTSEADPQGRRVTYIAVFETENEALEATLSNSPPGTSLDGLVEQAPEGLAERLNLQPESVQPHP